MTENTVKATKKSDVDPNFEKQINARQQDAKDEADNQKKGEQVLWSKPEGWDGDLTDWEKMKDPFKRTKANENFNQAVDDPKSPGNSGDLQATTLQIDYLSCMERAFRARHTSSFPRMEAHQLGRKQGHGHEKGVFKQLVLEYIRGILKQAGG